MIPERKELFSERVVAGSRFYFIDVRESAEKVNYLVISESRSSKDGAYTHNRIMIFEENIAQFADAINKALAFFDRRSGTQKLEEIRREFPNAYVKWTEDEDAKLKSEYQKRIAFPETETIQFLTLLFKRKPGAIRSRLRKLGLIESS